MTLIKSVKQLELHKLTTPLYSGKLVNRIDSERKQDTWIIKNSGKAVWLFDNLKIKAHFSTK
jgi:hypothetical protein